MDFVLKDPEITSNILKSDFKPDFLWIVKSKMEYLQIFYLMQLPKTGKGTN